MKNKEKYLEEFVRKSMIEKNGGIDFMKEHGIADYINSDEPMIVCIGKLLTWFEEECQEPILNSKERAYLHAIIEPWRDKVESVRKLPLYDSEYILIDFCEKGYLPIRLLFFSKGIVFKGMELYKNYTLKELEL